jgi:predicted Rossmann-fold nucleotide-binding protein
MSTISLADEEAVKQVLAGTVLGLWEAVNNLTRRRPSRRERRSIGIRVDLPFEHSVNPFVEQAFTHQTFFTRLHHFVLASDAFVVAPGGIGTVLEAAMIWQLLQVRHLESATPLIMVGRMWADFVEWARASMLDPRLNMVSEEDLAIPRCVATGDEAIALIREHHARWRQAAASNGGRP